MPDSLANRAQLLLIVGLVAGLALIPLAGWLWRKATGAKDGSGAGTALGLSVWAAALVWATVDIATWVQEQRRGAVAEGRILAFESETIRIARPGARIAEGRRETMVVPRIAFSTPDGRQHEFEALGGSLVGLEPGDRVQVRYDPADPSTASTVDFQNEFGALAFFGWLATLATLGAVWMGWGAVGDLQRERQAGRKPRDRSNVAPSAFARWRDGPGQALRAPLRQAGFTTFVLALLVPFALGLQDDAELLDAFVLALAGVAVALLWFGLRAALERGAASAHVLFGRLIGVIGFGLFAVFLGLLR